MKSTFAIKERKTKFSVIHIKYLVIRGQEVQKGTQIDKDGCKILKDYEIKVLKLVQVINISFGLKWLKITPNPNEEESFYN